MWQGWDFQTWFRYRSSKQIRALSNNFNLKKCFFMFQLHKERVMCEFYYINDLIQLEILVYGHLVK